MAISPDCLWIDPHSGPVPLQINLVKDGIIPPVARLPQHLRRWDYWMDPEFLLTVLQNSPHVLWMRAWVCVVRFAVI